MAHWKNIRDGYPETDFKIDEAPTVPVGRNANSMTTATVFRHNVSDISSTSTNTLSHTPNILRRRFQVLTSLSNSDSTPTSAAVPILIPSPYDVTSLAPYTTRPRRTLLSYFPSAGKYIYL